MFRHAGEHMLQGVPPLDWRTPDDSADDDPFAETEADTIIRWAHEDGMHLEQWQIRALRGSALGLPDWQRSLSDRRRVRWAGYSQAQTAAVLTELHDLADALVHDEIPQVAVCDRIAAIEQTRGETGADWAARKRAQRNLPADDEES